MNSAWVIALQEGVRCESDGSGNLAVSSWDAQVVLRETTPAIAAAVQGLKHPGSSVASLTNRFQPSGPGELAKFLAFFRRLAGHGLVTLSCRGDQGLLATLEPTSSQLDFSVGLQPDCQYLLSRFAYLQRVYDRFVLQTPLAPARVVLHDGRIAALLFSLTSPITAEAFCAQADFTTAESACALLDLLCVAKVLTCMTERGGAAEDEHESLCYWEFHDLLFHSQSRMGRHDNLIGATLDWAGVTPPPLAVRASYPGKPISLRRPDHNEIESRDPSLADVTARRRSVREYGDGPMTVAQLGEFLHRIGRVTRSYTLELPTAEGTVEMPLTARPYPAAGALYELEIYPVVQSCDGLAKGLYHYDPVNHQLVQVTAEERVTSDLLSHAALHAGMSVSGLQVLMVLSARFPRISWKYAGIAYSVILKDVGVLMHSMYLTATAMGLAPCALGLGDSDLFAKAIGSDYYAETSVGEFLLGSMPENATD